MAKLLFAIFSFHVWITLCHVLQQTDHDIFLYFLCVDTQEFRGFAKVADFVVDRKFIDLQGN